MIRYLSLCLLILLTSTLLNAQELRFVLKGKVTDAKTGQPLEGALISTPKPSEGALTNAVGLFLLETGFTTLQVQFTGYQSIKVTYSNEELKNGQIKNILLQPDEELLGQVVVTAGKTRQKITQTTVSMESVKPYLIENKNPVSMEQIADQIPGVAINDGQVNIRGGSGWSYGSGSRVMVLVDGLPMLSGDAGSVQWSFLPMENIKNIEVLKGASSVLFGSAALNGIINIQTNNPGENPQTSITTFGGLYSAPGANGLHWQKGPLTTSGLRAFHAFRTNNNEWTFAANLLNDDGYRMGDFENRARIGFTHRWVPADKKIIAGLNGNFQQGRSASFLLWQSYDSAYTAYNRGITTTHARRLNADPHLTWYTGKTRHQLKGRWLWIDNAVDNGNPANNQSNSSNYFYSEYQNEFKRLPRGIKLTSGAVWAYTLTRSPLFSGKQTAANAALYLQLEKSWKKLILNAGARAEHYSLNNYKETKPVLRAGCNYQAGRYTFIRASFGQGYRFPTIAESYISTSVGPLKIFPNPGLTSETGWNAEAGIKQGFAIGGFKGFADFALFYTRYSNMMEFTFAQWSSDISAQNGFGAGFRSINVGENMIRGTELSVSGEGKVGNTHIQLLAGYTYMDSKNLHPDKILMTDSTGNAITFFNTSSNPQSSVLKYRPRHLAKADVQLNRGNWMLGASGRFNSYIQNIDKAFVSFPLSLFIRDIEKGRQETRNGVFVADIRGGYAFNKTFKLNVVVLNVFNKIYMGRPADMQPPRSISIQALLSI